MENINYQQLYAKFTKNLSDRTKEVFARRFGVPTGKGKKPVEPETLESIGDSFGITRERVRQIEETGFHFIKKNHKDALDSVFAQLVAYFESKGGFKKESVAFADFGGAKNEPYVRFLFVLSPNLNRVCEKRENYDFWHLANRPVKGIKETLSQLAADLAKHGKVMTLREMQHQFGTSYQLDNPALASYLEIAKRIQPTKEGSFGLVDWPEVKPRGVRDRAFLIFKHHQKPLHFREITKLIDEEHGQQDKKTHPQTVHNELIKDERFVLVGRGTYALGEWGYVPGTIKDVITRIMKEKQAALSQDEVVKAVLAQRLVAKNTIIINLNNKQHFSKDANGNYVLRPTLTA